jgi:hypothetical protein
LEERVTLREELAQMWQKFYVDEIRRAREAEARGDKDNANMLFACAANTVKVLSRSG